jgi:uncharacterized membrane protein
MSEQRSLYTLKMLIGIAMSLAILGHTRLFFHYWNTDPADLSHTTLFLFFTLFISHYFATAVYFIIGIQLYLIMHKKTKKQNLWYLLTLGSVLLFIEILVDNFLYTFDPHYRTIGLFVIGSLGLCMLCMAVIQYYSRNLILVISLFIILGHHLLDSIQMKGNSIPDLLWYALHQQKFIPQNESMYIIKYTILPWLGLLLLGYYLGSFYKSGSVPAIRKKILLYSGWIFIILFFLLRSINRYGDQNPWQIHNSTVTTVISFFNLTKYPASLDYLAITLGPILLFLVYAENWKNPITNFFFILGKFPLFTYLFSTFLIHFTAMAWLVIVAKPFQMMVITPASYGNQSLLVNYGYSLVPVYLLSAAFIIICYFVAKKQTSSGFYLLKKLFKQF